MVVRPAMLYGAEYWPLKEKHNTKLSVAEMRMLRRMSGFTLRDRIRNEHICEKVGVAPMEDKIRESRLRWFGHIKRRPSNDPVRKLESLRRHIKVDSELREPVTKKELVAEVARQLCVNIHPDNIHLPSPLSSLGEYEVVLRLPREIPRPEGLLQWTLNVKVRRK